MTDNINQNPEQIARDRTDKMLTDSGWIVQSKKKVDLLENIRVAVREYQIDVGPAVYVLFIDRQRTMILRVCYWHK